MYSWIDGGRRDVSDSEVAGDSTSTARCNLLLAEQWDNTMNLLRTTE